MVKIIKSWGIILLATLNIIQYSLIYLRYGTVVEELTPKQTLQSLQFHQRRS